MNNLIRERKHRLDTDCYKGFVRVHFTLCVKDKRCVFTNEKIFNQLQQILIEQLTIHCVVSDVFLFMPDHAHILLTGNHDNAYVYQCIVKFKQRSGYLFSREYPDVVWQKDFYDHIVRKDEDTEKVIMYILENPVRKEFVDDWKVYPFKGSTIHNFNEW